MLLVKHGSNQKNNSEGLAAFFPHHRVSCLPSLQTEHTLISQSILPWGLLKRWSIPSKVAFTIRSGAKRYRATPFINEPAHALKPAPMERRWNAKCLVTNWAPCLLFYLPVCHPWKCSHLLLRHNGWSWCCSCGPLPREPPKLHWQCLMHGIWPVPHVCNLLYLFIYADGSCQPFWTIWPCVRTTSCWPEILLQ